VGQGASYTDCFVASVSAPVALPQFISAFYGSSVFGAERWILSLATRRRISADAIAALAAGDSTIFAVWHVEARLPEQILLKDKGGYTASWLGVAHDGTGTRVMLGSAIISQRGRLPLAVRSIIPLHRAYSKTLLRSAVKQLE
jgi:hypothetical protein